MTVLLPSDYEWKTRTKSPITPNDPLTTYHHLVKEMAGIDDKRWRKMLAVLAEAERVYPVSPVTPVVIPTLAEAGR